MDFFLKLGDTLAEVGQDVALRAKDLAENTKLSIDIHAKEEYINKQYASLGRKIYEMREGDGELKFEEFELIREAKQEVARMQGQLAERKGMKKCCSCQAVMPQDALFCPSCGTKDETPFEEE